MAGILLTLLAAGGLLFYVLRVGVGNERHISGVVESANCKAGSNSASSIAVMTFNAYLINCSPTGLVACESKEKRKKRVKKFAEWFGTRSEDVIMFQEVWSFHDDLKKSMADAGFCHFVMTTKKRGSGLAIFSKFPIEAFDFTDWYDAFGIGDGKIPVVIKNPDAVLFDKGILYAKIKKDEDTNFNLFNLHTTSDTLGDAHEIRLEQYNIIHDYVQEKQIPSTEMVLLGGDFNEDKFCSQFKCGDEDPFCKDQAYYNTMVETLNADMLTLKGNQMFTYDATINKMLKVKYADDECSDSRYLLDYILYSKAHLIPTKSSTCEILLARDPSEADLSDHFPIACEFKFLIDATGTAGVPQDSEL